MIKYKLLVLANRLRCFFIGHDIRMGNTINDEPDYCARCFMDWPQESITIPVILNRIYCWLVMHETLERIDDYIIGKLGNKRPSWWVY